MQLFSDSEILETAGNRADMEQIGRRQFSAATACRQARMARQTAGYNTLFGANDRTFVEEGE